MNFLGSIFIIILLLSGCCKLDFDKNQALEDFSQLKPNAKLQSCNIYGCSGIECECTYAEFKYTLADSNMIFDTTFQYWLKENTWILRVE